MLDKKLKSIVHAENLLIKMLNQPKYLSCKNVEEIESLMKFKEIYKQLKNNA
jgi:hypothetical protein